MEPTARIWDSTTWPPRQPVSFGRQMAPRLGGDEKLAREIDANVENDYNQYR